MIVACELCDKLIDNEIETNRDGYGNSICKDCLNVLEEGKIFNERKDT